MKKLTENILDTQVYIYLLVGAAALLARVQAW